MALGTIAPWLQLPDYRQAAEAGARIGLQQRQAAEEAALARAKLAQEGADAAGRLGLGYSELSARNDEANAARELTKSNLDLKRQAEEDAKAKEEARFGLSEKRFQGLENNRDVVNQLRQDQLDSLNDQRDAVNALRGTRLPVATKEKAFTVKVPVPANPETGEAATTVALPSTHPAAKRYLKSIGMGETPPESVTGLLDPDTQSQGGETLPLPTTATESTPPAAAALQPRNRIYTGRQTDNPIFDPGTMPPEELPTPVQASAAKPVLTTGKKRFRFDPATGKFDPVE